MSFFFFFFTVLLPRSNKFGSSLNCHPDPLTVKICPLYYKYAMMGETLSPTRLCGHQILFGGPRSITANRLSIFIYNSFFAARVDCSNSPT